MNLIMKIVELDNKGLADLGSRKGRQMTYLHSENAGKALRKPRDFGWRDVGAISQQSELYAFYEL